jgi:predicted HTH transcriptional regulator
MSEWTKQWLDQMIADGVQESLILDYKRADALAKTDRQRIDITKDVSAFANSSGGVVIYGMAEFTIAPSVTVPNAWTQFGGLKSPRSG